MNDESRRFATLDDDGWSLLDAEDMVQRGDGIYWLPGRWTRDHLEEHVPANGFAKVVFRILDPIDTRKPAIERMWVTLGSRDGDSYHGHLANAPETLGAAVEGMPVWFRAEHVIDYCGPNGEGKASESADAVRCARHGLSDTCYVCVHITPDTARLGFNTADTTARRPDAWCNECHKEFLRAGSWEAPGVTPPKIKVVCGGCYDDLKESHGTGPQ